MIQLLNLSLIVAHIVANCPAFAGRVYAAVPDEEINVAAQQDPLAFVYVPKYSANDAGLSGMTVQHFMHSVTIESIVRRSASAEDLYNQSAYTDLNAARAELMTALIGWQPSWIFKQPVVAEEGELQKKAKTLNFRDQFLFYTTIRQ